MVNISEGSKIWSISVERFQNMVNISGEVPKHGQYQWRGSKTEVPELNQYVSLSHNLLKDKVVEI